MTSIGKSAKKPLSILILGAGWGGFFCASKLAGINAKITIVANKPTFSYTPLLCQYSTGHLRRSAAEESVEFVKSKNVSIIYGKALSVDDGTQNVEVLTENNDKQKIAYDKLIVSIGSHPNTYGIPGIKENMHTIYTTDNSEKLLSYVNSLIKKAEKTENIEEKKSLLQFVVVGAGPTSIEYAYDLSTRIKQKAPSLAPYMSIIMLDVASSILPSVPDSMRNHVQKSIANQGICLRLNQTILRATSKTLVLKSGEIPYSALIWGAGIKPNPLPINSIKPSRTGEILVDNELCAIGSKNIYAIGDCSMMEKPIPKTAQVAHQQAEYLVKNIISQIPRRFEYNHMGMFIPLGSRNGSLYVERKNTKPFVLNGILAVWAARMFTLTSVPSYRMRFELLYDWIVGAPSS